MADLRAGASRTAIEDRAAEWLVRKDSDRFGKVEEQELDAWLSQSSHHAVAYYRLEAAWAATHRLKVLRSGLRHQVSPARTRTSTWVVPYVAAAASVLLTFGFYRLSDKAFHGYRYSTPLGAVATLPLADGSWVTLNTDTVIRIGLTPTMRRVDLERGEAFFRVAKDRNRPFVVVAQDSSVTAVGTEFAVRQDGAMTRVIVAEGRVRFETDTHKSAMPVAAGEIAEVRAGGAIVVQDKPLAQVEESLSWRHGFVVFHETPLADATAELNRYNARKIRVADTSAAAIPICGALRTDNIDGFMRLMKDEFRLEMTPAISALQANDAPVRSIVVPPGDLSVALEAVVQQPRLELLYRCEQLKGFHTPGASGQFTGPQTLSRLIQGTPLTLKTDPTGAVLVVSPRHFLGPY